MDVRDDFERCWPWLRDSLEFAAFKHNGQVWFSHHKEHVWERIDQKKCIFWPASDSAIVTNIYTSPAGLRDHHTWLAGGDLEQIVERMPRIEDFGRQMGAHRQTGSGRLGWLRAFDGYEKIGVRKAKALI